MRLVGTLVALCLLGAVAHGQALFSKVAVGPVASQTSNSRSCTVGDVDGDGDLDLFIANDGVAADLYLNNGAGAFSVAPTPVTTPTGSASDALLVDIDRDDDLDLLVAHRFGDPLRFFRNQGGTPTVFVEDLGDPITSSGGDTTSLAAGDVDGDGDVDVIVTNGNNITNRLFLNAGGLQGGVEGTFVASTSGDFLDDVSNTTACALGDIDGDGDLDLVVANAGGQDNVLYLNDGAGVFDVSDVDIEDGGDSQDVELADLDGDDDLDIVFVNFLEANFVYRNRGNAQGGLEGVLDLVLGHPLSLGAGQLSLGITLGDWNDDGLLDALILNCCGQPNALYENDGDFLFTQVFAGVVAADSGYSFDACFFDFDGDTDDDLIVVNSTFSGDNRNALYRNDLVFTGSAGFTDLGGGMGGATGVPVLAATGTLVPTSPASFIVSEAPPLTFGSLIIGFQQLDAPFKGGLLIPSADYGLAFPTDAAGAFRLDGIWPPGVPSGLKTYYQAWLVDGSVVPGATALRRTPAAPHSAASARVLYARARFAPL